MLLLERRNVLGGAAVTEELVDGFKFSRASYLAGLLRPKVRRCWSTLWLGLVQLRLAESQKRVVVPFFCFIVTHTAVCVSCTDH